MSFQESDEQLSSYYARKRKSITRKSAKVTKKKRIECSSLQVRIEGSTEQKYKPLMRCCDRILAFFESIQSPLAHKLKSFTINLLTMPWQDSSNGTDCGVYCLRHMETYMGDSKSWDCGITKRNAKRKLHWLRLDYLCRILQADSNNMRARLTYLQKKLYQS